MKLLEPSIIPNWKHWVILYDQKITKQVFLPRYKTSRKLLKT